MNNVEKTFELMTKMYNEMNKGFRDVYDEMHNGFKEVNEKIDEVKKTVANIENDHGQKLSALFDGYSQNSSKLDRIETELSKHEEIILRRVR